MTNRKSIIVNLLPIWIVILVAVAGLVYFSFQVVQPRREPAPNFELTLLNGEKVTLADFRGKPLIINFWASW